MATVPGKSSQFSDLKLRILSASVFAAIAFGAVWMGGAIWLLFVIAAAIILLGEWWRLTKPNLLLIIAGIPYVILPCLSLLALRNLTSGDSLPSMWPVLFLVIVVAATDIGAYFTGRLIGGPKLAPRFSPNKTWAGLLGGMSAAAIAAVSMMGMVSFPDSTLTAIACGAGLAVLAQIGDLFESAMKRRAGVKDSGTILPGHGGLLDRVDGLMFTAPVMAGLHLYQGSVIS